MVALSTAEAWMLLLLLLLHIISSISYAQNPMGERCRHAEYMQVQASNGMQACNVPAKHRRLRNYVVKNLNIDSAILTDLPVRITAS